MKNEVISIIKAAYPNPTKAIKIVMDLIEEVPVDVDQRYSDSVR